MCLLSITFVLREEIEQQTLLVGNSVIKEVPRRSSIDNSADRIVEQNLRTDGEVEPPGVGGMTEKPAMKREEKAIRIETRRYELMRSLLFCLNVVIEIPLHLDFGYRSEKSSAKTECETQPKGNPMIAKDGDKEVLYPVLCHSSNHCNFVLRTLVHQISYCRKPSLKPTIKRQLVLSIYSCDKKLAQVKGCNKNHIPRPIYLSVQIN